MKKKIIIIVLLVVTISLFADTGMKEKIIETLEKQGFSAPLMVFLLSMLPIFELRLAIPLGILQFNLSPVLTYFIAVAGNMVPIFFILIFFDLVTKIFMKIPFFAKILNYIFDRTRKRSQVIEKYEELGLILFVAIPLPVTGGWTGSLAAYLFGLNFWKSILCIFVGVCIAGIVVTILTLLGWIGAGIALLALTLLVVFSIFKKKSNKH